MRLTAGVRLGRLVTVRIVGTREYKSGSANIWLCACDCGGTKDVVASNLTKGITNSCGCLHRELLSARNTRHGLAGTQLYSVWSMMLQRCNNPKNKGFKDWGGRGIRVCDEWSDFAVFHADMSPGYKQGLTIERTDNDGPYCKANCVWATRAVQGSNKRSTVRFVLGSETLCLEEAARRLGVASSAIRYWRRKGLSDAEIAERFSDGNRPPRTSLPRRGCK